MPLQDSWTLHYSERSNARARAQAFEEQVSGGVKQSHLVDLLSHCRTSLSSLSLPGQTVTHHSAWLSTPTCVCPCYAPSCGAHVRLPMLRAFLRCTRCAVIARTAICRAEARSYFEFLDRCRTLIWHTPSGTHSQPHSHSQGRPLLHACCLAMHCLRMLLARMSQHSRYCMPAVSIARVCVLPSLNSDVCRVLLRPDTSLRLCEQVKELGTFSDVQSFWEHFSHMAPAGELPVVSDYHLFKKGVKPMWEDPVNEKGGVCALQSHRITSHRITAQHSTSHHSTSVHVASQQKLSPHSAMHSVQSLETHLHR
jgi:hypothetical protein